MAECTCFLLPPEMHYTHYGATEPGSTHEFNPDCPEHRRRGQYCKDCLGTGVIVTRGRFIDGEDWCETCDAMGTINRTGPYRLADGTWSDGIDRSEPMGEREVAMRRWEVWRDRGDTGEWTAGFDPDEWVGASEKNFPTHAEAIAYADAQARTTKNGGAS